MMAMRYGDIPDTELTPRVVNNASSLVAPGKVAADNHAPQSGCGLDQAAVGPSCTCAG